MDKKNTKSVKVVKAATTAEILGTTKVAAFAAPYKILFGSGRKVPAVAN